jgi:flagellar biosynthesis protein FliR
MTMPLFTATGVPKHVPVFLALAFAFVVTPIVPEVAMPEQTALLLMGVVSEFLIGALLGSTVYTMFSAIAIGTQIMAIQGGLGMASMPNPMVKGQGSALNTMASWMSGLVFLGMGLHYKFIAILIESFRVIAPGDGGLRIFNVGPTLIYVVGRTIEVGISLSGPVLGMVFIVNLFIAIMSKLAPKMNMFFSVGFTLSSGFAMILFGISLTWLIAAHSAEMAYTPEYVIRCLEGMR